MAREPAVLLSDIDARLKQIERELERLAPLQIERDMLQRLRSKALTSKTRRTTAADADVPTTGRSIPLTELIVNAVTNSPGLTKEEIVGRMQAVSDKSRRIILTTIGNLVAKGRLRPDGQGGYHPPEGRVSATTNIVVAR